MSPTSTRPRAKALRRQPEAPVDHDMQAPAPIFLYTDFGSADLYVGQVKAVLHAEAPGIPSSICSTTRRISTSPRARISWPRCRSACRRPRSRLQWSILAWAAHGLRSQSKPKAAGSSVPTTVSCPSSPTARAGAAASRSPGCPNRSRSRSMDAIFSRPLQHASHAARSTGESSRRKRWTSRWMPGTSRRSSTSITTATP